MSKRRPPSQLLKPGDISPVDLTPGGKKFSNPPVCGDFVYADLSWNQAWDLPRGCRLVRIRSACRSLGLPLTHPLPAMSGPAAVTSQMSTAPGVPTTKALATSEALRCMPADTGTKPAPTSSSETLLRVPAAEKVLTP